MGLHRVMIMGIDGGSWDIIDPWIKLGKLPTFAKLQKEGSWGVLRSTIPPLSPIAWTSMFTGVNPGKHGIYGFVKIKDGTYDITPVSAKDRKAKPLWTVVSEFDKRVIVINVPITYPPDPVNGIMISGLGAPSKNANFVYPASFKGEIFKNIPSYDIDFDEELFRLTGNKKQLLNKIITVMEAREHLVHWLLQREQWVLFIIIFRAPDVIQHFFWNKPPVLLAIYQILDRIISRIRQKLNENETTLIICSDHGFERVIWHINMYNWLRSLGLLKFRREIRPVRPNIKFISPEAIQRSLLQLRMRNFVWKIKKSSLLSRILRSQGLIGTYFDVDWQQTKAFFVPGTYSMIQVNLKGREPKGTVLPQEYEQIRTKIISASDKLIEPKSGKKVIRRAYKKEEIYKGDNIGQIPDIILQKSSGIEFFAEKTSRRIFNSPMQGNVYRPGDHCEKGMIAMAGPAIPHNYQINPQITDIFPTVIELLKLSAPISIDGKSILQSMKEET